MNAFFCHTAHNPSWLPALRIGTGLILLCAYGSQLADMPMLYGTQPFIPTDLLTVVDEVPFVLHHRSGTSTILYGSLCALLCLGLCTRLVATLLLLQHTLLYTALPQLSYGFDYFCVNALFYCAVFPADRYYSVDRKLPALPPSRWTTPSLRTLQLHLCIVYFFAGALKAVGTTWHNGEAIWRAYQLPVFTGVGYVDPGWSSAYPAFWAVLGWGVIVIETAYPAMVWIERIRPYWLVATVALHSGIALVMGLYAFSAIMILLNLCAFHLPYQSSSLRGVRGTSKPASTPNAGCRKGGIVPF